MKFYNFNHANPSDALKLLWLYNQHPDISVNSDASRILIETPNVDAIIRVTFGRHDTYKLVVDVYPRLYDPRIDTSFTLDLFGNIDIICSFEIEKCIKILSFITGLKLNEIGFITSEGIV